jgi:hypothetical protein
MLPAFHFLSSDMRSDEDMFAGDERPWLVGEVRGHVAA